MKKFYLKKYLPLFFMVLVTGRAVAQDLHFSQFAETPLYRNPALAGIVNGDVRVQAVYRDQWNSIAHAYKTASLNAEYKVPVGKGDDFLTMGLLMFYDKAGTAELTTTHVMPALNFHKSISSKRNMYLSAGFMGGVVQRRFDISKITSNNQYDGTGQAENFVQPNYTYLDGSAGLSFNAGISNNPDDNLVLGIAYHHFNNPQNSFFSNYNLVVNPKWVFSADVKFNLNEYSSVTILSNYSRQSGAQEIIAGILYGMKFGPLTDQPDYIIQGGVFIRANDAVIPVIKVGRNPLSFALSYDVNVSKLKTTSYGRGGFELSLTYIGFSDRNSSSLNAVRCPRF